MKDPTIQSESAWFNLLDFDYLKLLDVKLKILGVFFAKSNSYLLFHYHKHYLYKLTLLIQIPKI